MKHVFPILLRPHKPGLWLLNECLEFEFLTLEFEENPLYVGVSGGEFWMLMEDDPEIDRVLVCLGQ